MEELGLRVNIPFTFWKGGRGGSQGVQASLHTKSSKVFQQNKLLSD